MIARRGGRGGHAVSVPTDTALLKFGDRVKPRNCRSGPGTLISKAFRNSNSYQYYCVTQAHTTRSTPTDD
eukprot:scaffold143292_cov133-Phaeocystis_antarctica.AAC.1